MCLETLKTIVTHGTQDGEMPVMEIGVLLYKITDATSKNTGRKSARTVRGKGAGHASDLSADPRDIDLDAGNAKKKKQSHESVLNKASRAL